MEKGIITIKVVHIKDKYTIDYALGLKGKIEVFGIFDQSMNKVDPESQKELYNELLLGVQPTYM